MFIGKSIRNDAEYSAPTSSYEVCSITTTPCDAQATSQTLPTDEVPTLRDKGIFIISEAFTASLAKQVITWILESNLNPTRDYDHLTLIINSPGGEVASAFAIIDTMRGSAIPVHTIGLGQISSCGFLCFIAGEKGHRVITPNTSILSHQWSWGIVGKQHELIATTRQYELITQRMFAHYKSCLAIDEETIREKLLPAHDVWLSAQEALDLGVCDEIRIVGA